MSDHDHPKSAPSTARWAFRFFLHSCSRWPIHQSRANRLTISTAWLPRALSLLSAFSVGALFFGLSFEGSGLALRVVPAGPLFPSSLSPHTPSVSTSRISPFSTDDLRLTPMNPETPNKSLQPTPSRLVSSRYHD